MSEATMIRLADVHFGYDAGSFALRVDDLAIERGQRVACIGQSGTGKTTLVHLIAGILVPTRGTIDVAGDRVSALPERERRARRLTRIGMVFQELELIEYLSALDNVLLPYHLARNLRVDAAARGRTKELARATGIEELLLRRPRLLSQGERQRVAVARALVTEPALVLCDEPTGNLDPDTARQILDLLFDQVERVGATLLMVTHDHSILDRFDRVVDMAELAAGVAG